MQKFSIWGTELVNVVRRCLYALVERGAKPRHWGSPSHPDRDILLHDGNDTNEEIVEGVIADWLARAEAISSGVISGLPFPELSRDR